MLSSVAQMRCYIESYHSRKDDCNEYEVWPYHLLDLLRELQHGELVGVTDVDGASVLPVHQRHLRGWKIVDSMSGSCKWVFGGGRLMGC